MATIDYRGWRISSDPECWTLGKPKLRMNAKKQQEIYLSHPTYYPTLALAIQGLLERELRASDAASANDILRLLREMKAELQAMVPA